MELILGQIWYIFASLLWGFFLMFLYDFILVFRGRKRRTKIRLFLEDWLFWAIASVFVFQMIFAINNGILRSTFVIAFLVGMTGYRKLVKKRVQIAIKAVFSFVFRPYVWILKKIKKKKKIP